MATSKFGPTPETGACVRYLTFLELSMVELELNIMQPLAEIGGVIVLPKPNRLAVRPRK